MTLLAAMRIIGEGCGAINAVFEERSSWGWGLVQFGAESPRRPRIPAVSEAKVKAPSEMFAVGESRWMQAAGVINNVDCVDGMFCGYLGKLPLLARHGKNYNQLFCDGHVGAMSPWRLFNPTNTAPLWNSDHQPH